MTNNIELFAAGWLAIAFMSIVYLLARYAKFSENRSLLLSVIASLSLMFYIGLGGLYNIVVFITFFMEGIKEWYLKIY